VAAVGTVGATAACVMTAVVDALCARNPPGVRRRGGRLRGGEQPTDGQEKGEMRWDGNAAMTGHVVLSARGRVGLNRRQLERTPFSASQQLELHTERAIRAARLKL
jgi:hypothetical protein